MTEQQTAAMRKALEQAYLAGFNASGEGYNGECPFGDHGTSPENDRGWIYSRNDYVNEAIEQEPFAASTKGEDMRTVPEIIAALESDHKLWQLGLVREAATALRRTLEQQPAAWEGLTDEETAACFEARVISPRLQADAKRIEAKLKENNSGKTTTATPVQDAAAELRRLHEVNAGLLEALRHVHNNGADWTAQSYIRAAITRATGEQK